MEWKLPIISRARDVLAATQGDGVRPIQLTYIYSTFLGCPKVIHPKQGFIYWENQKLCQIQNSKWRNFAKAEKWHFLSLAKFFLHWKSVLHQLAKTLPRFRKNQKLSQCPSDIVIVIYKSLLPLTGQLWNGKEEIVSFFIYLIANWKSFYLMWKSFYRRILRQSFFNAFFFKGWLSSVRFKYKPSYKPCDL